MTIRVWLCSGCTRREAEVFCHICTAYELIMVGQTIVTGCCLVSWLLACLLAAHNTVPGWPQWACYKVLGVCWSVLLVTLDHSWHMLISPCLHFNTKAWAFYTEPGFPSLLCAHIYKQASMSAHLVVDMYYLYVRKLQKILSY